MDHADIHTWARRKIRELLHHAKMLNAIEYGVVAMLREEIQR